MFLLALGVGAGLRFYALGRLPDGVYHDEAFYGLDALTVLDGARPIFFPANNGREPAYIYLLSLSVAAFGRTPFGLRFAPALLGTLTIPVTYLLGRALLNRRVGLLAMMICAITFWPVALSRVSFRAGALPLFLGLAVALAWLGLRRRSLTLAVLGGACYGLALNTYTASRITPLALGLAAAAALWLSPGRAGGLLHRFRREAAAYLLTAAAVVAPLAWYALAHPQQVLARPEQVSIFRAEGADPAAALIRHAGLAIGMFGWHGDTIARHNLPGRPVFDPWMFAAFVGGLALALSRARRHPGSAFVLLWTGVMILPTLLAEDTPHFLRAVGLLPVLWLIPAMALDALLARFPSRLAAALVGVMVGLSTIVTAYDYFARYAADPATGYFFESAATDLAAEIASRPGDAARIDDRLWDNFASLRFLIADRDGGGSADRVLLAVWPYEPDEVRAAVAALPAGSQITARRGPLAKGDLEIAPYSLYTLYIAEPARPGPAVGSFGDLIELRAAEVLEGGDAVRVRLGWAAAGRGPIETDYRFYVHVLGGDGIVAQVDGEPLGGLYHFSWLRPGDVVYDEVVLPWDPRGQIVVGLYAPDGRALGEALALR